MKINLTIEVKNVKECSENCNWFFSRNSKRLLPDDLCLLFTEYIPNRQRCKSCIWATKNLRID